MTAFLLLAGGMPGWGLEPYRATPLLARAVMGVAGAILAALFWTRRALAARTFSILSSPPHAAILLPILWALFILLRERRYIGDWINIAFTLPAQPSWMLNDYIVWRAPLTNLLQYVQWQVILNPLVGHDTLYGWQVLLALYGVVLIAGQWLAARAAFGSRRTSVAYVILYATSGMLFYSLGHVENYVIPMAILAFTAWASFRAIRRRRGGALAFAWFGAAAMSHPQCVIFAPSMLAVWWMCRPPRGRIFHAVGCLAAMLAVPALLVAIVLVAGIGIDARSVAGGDPGGTLLPPLEALSWARLHDLLMILVRVFPALPAVALILVLRRRRLKARDPIGLWLALGAGPALTFCFFIWNKAPMPIDWDLMGPSLMMIWMAALYGMLRAIPARRRIQAVLCVAALQLPHTAVWIGWNLTPDAKQAAMLIDLRKAVDKARGAPPGYMREPNIPPVGLAPAPTLPFDAPVSMPPFDALVFMLPFDAPAPPNPVGFPPAVSSPSIKSIASTASILSISPPQPPIA